MTATVPIAVVIPCYNYGRFLGEALRSALGQTVQPAELLVVDDGSTDDTRDVCQRFFPQVRYLRKENGGLSSARNAGLRASTARWVMFADADDLLAPTGLERLWRARAACPADVGAVFGWAEIFCESGRENAPPFRRIPLAEDLIGCTREKLSDDAWVLSGRILERLVESNVVPACAAIVDRGVYAEVGLFDETLRSMEDHDMWLRIASRYALCFVDQPVARVRRHGANITDPSNSARNHRVLLEILESTARATWAPRRLRRWARRQYAAKAYWVSQGLAEARDFDGAARLLWAALAKRPISPKTFVRAVQYSWQRSVRSRPRHEN